MKRLLIFLPILCLISCTQYNDIETVVQIQERNVSSELVEQTRLQLIERLKNTGCCQEVNIKQGETPIQFDVSAKISEYYLTEYRAAFENAELGMWHTYQITDREVETLLEQLATIPNIELNTGTHHPSVFAVSQSPNNLPVIKKELGENLPENIRFFWSAKPKPSWNSELTFHQLYAIDTKGKPTAIIRNEHIVEARHNLDQARNVHVVNFDMNEEGALALEKMTEQALKREIAIIINGKVNSAPTVQSPIAGGRMEITGNFTAEEATRLASIISQSPLPYTLKIIDEKITTPE